MYVDYKQWGFILTLQMKGHIENHSLWNICGHDNVKANIKSSVQYHFQVYRQLEGILVLQTQGHVWNNVRFNSFYDFHNAVEEKTIAF